MLDFLKSKDRLLFEKGYITEEEYLTRRSDGRFSKAIVMSAVVAVTLYVIILLQFAYLNIQSHTNVFPPVEVTTGYFAFWTVEIVMLATLRRSKIKNKHEKDEKEVSVKDDIQRNETKGSIQSSSSRNQRDEVGGS